VALEQFGRASDILINNFGVGDSTPFEQITDEKWAWSIEVNLMGTVRTCRALVPNEKRSDHLSNSKRTDHLSTTAVTVCATVSIDASMYDVHAD